MIKTWKVLLALSHRPCVCHVNMIWSRGPSPACTCFRLGLKKKQNKKKIQGQREIRSRSMTARLYLCEFPESTGQLQQHASLLSFHRWWSRCALAGGCFHAYITALRQHADFICKYTDSRAGVRCLWGVRVRPLELLSVSALETHICFRVAVRNTISSTLSSLARWGDGFDLRYSCNQSNSEQSYSIVYNSI